MKTRHNNILARFTGLLRLGISMIPLLVLLQIALPVLPQLHLALAGHSHVLNPLTGSYEDIIVLSTNTHHTATTDDETGLRRENDFRVMLVWCSIANLTGLSLTSGPSKPLCLSPLPSRAPCNGAILEHADAEVLLHCAPKHSPPLSA